MIKIKNYIQRIYRVILSSIAFYPTLISLGFMMLAIIVMALESNGVTEYLIDNVPFLVINNADTARTIMSTFIAGLLSLMVFSFSMVMLILNQASSNYSPRLLPELISNKRHQVVLGFYLGTIIYCILVLIAILPDGDAYTLPGFSILLGIVLGITCLGMFVYFIHTISKEIQINFILERIFNRTRNRLNTLIERAADKAPKDFPETDNWQPIFGDRNGYFQGISKESLLELAVEHDTVFEILPVKGMFILKGIPVAKCKKELSEEATNEVLSCLNFSANPSNEANYVSGIKNITEIAVKAMSPGINDPGTAINAIDYLTELFALRMELSDRNYLVDEENKLRILQKTVDFKELTYNVLASLRQYCKHDVLIAQKILLMLKYLHQNATSKKQFEQVITREIEILMDDADRFIKNKTDLKVLGRLADSILKKHESYEAVF